MFVVYDNIGKIQCRKNITLILKKTSKGREYKWVCPCIFCYLSSIIPSLVLLRVRRSTLSNALDGSERERTLVSSGEPWCCLSTKDTINSVTVNVKA